MTMTLWLGLGLGLGSAFLAYARSQRAAEQRVLAVGLWIAALIYVGFAAWEGAGAPWVGLELAGVAAYGGLAWISFHRSTHWLAAGWALHVIWDVGLHLLGPGAAFAPEAYALLCISFDFLVAAYLVFGFSPASGPRAR